MQKKNVTFVQILPQIQNIIGETIAIRHLAKKFQSTQQNQHVQVIIMQHVTYVVIVEMLFTDGAIMLVVQIVSVKIYLIQHLAHLKIQKH